MRIPARTLCMGLAALLLPILVAGCRKSEAIRPTTSSPRNDSSTEVRSAALVPVRQDTSLPSWSVMGGENFHLAGPGWFQSGQLQDTTPIRMFALVDSFESWGLVQLQWGQRSRDLVLASRNRLAFTGRWHADTFEVSLRKGARTKGGSVPPGCMCKPIPPKDFLVRLSFEDRPRIWLRLARKGTRDLLVRWDSSGARVGDADSVTALAVSTFTGSFGWKSLLFCRGMPFCKP